MVAAALALSATCSAFAGLTAADGARIAEAKCGRCHAVGAKDESQYGMAPPFRRFHEAYPLDMLLEARHTGVVSGHDEMPMFDFTADEIRALLLHIDSLAPDTPGYIERVPAGPSK